MKTIEIEKREIKHPFIVPPENGGQIVEVSYSCTESYILVATLDKSDGSQKIEAYDWPRSGEFEPWNCAPKMGRYRGPVTIKN